jgi:hypothetical protein
VERDDAELRFLELDEKAHSAVALARAMQDHLGQVVTKLDPPKPVPEPEPTPQAHESTDPMPTPATDLITPYLPPSPPVAEVVHSLDPISPTTDGTGPVLGSDAPASDTGSGGTPAPEWVSVPSTPTPAPSDPIGTGMGNVASSSEPNPTTPPSSDGTGLGGSDPEPTKFTTRDDGTPSTTITQSWWDWYDRQSYEFRQAYRF